MRSTLNNLSSKKQGHPEIEVLLATFNGEEYLETFLESLANQEDVRIRLIVSDDGSTDKTLEILRKFNGDFLSMEIFEGPKAGILENFFNLIKLSKGEFVALADQDDVWKPKKLISAIEHIERTRNSAQKILYIGSTISSSNQFLESKLFSFPLNWFRGNNLGMTFVLNKKLVNHLKVIDCSNLIAHDWSIQLIAQSCGQVILDSSPQSIYRLHSKNAIGLSNACDRVLRYWKYKQILSRKEKLILQMKAISHQLGPDMSAKDMELLNELNRAMNSKLIYRIAYVLRYFETFSSSPATYLWFCTMVLIPSVSVF